MLIRKDNPYLTLITAILQLDKRRAYNINWYLGAFLDHVTINEELIRENHVARAKTLYKSKDADIEAKDLSKK